MTTRHYATLAACILFGTSAFAQWQPPGAASGPIFYNGGNVGIGTATPAEKLVIQGNVPAQVRQIVSNQNATGTADSIWSNDLGIALAFQLGSSGKPGTIWGVSWSNMGRFTNTGGPIGVGTDNAFPLFLATNSNVRVTVDTTGRVGIGTTTPAALLDVNGDINVVGNINAKYQDVAEWVDSSSDLEPGTVVILDPEHSNRVMPSSTSYDTSVAGVVSGRPGITLGEASASKVRVAANGRVRVKVDATRLPIRIGDLLVSSDKTGLAMRSEPIDIGGHKIHQPGTVIGKALEPLAGEVGEILVLLALQ
jgi:hypothetical protein